MSVFRFRLQRLLDVAGSVRALRESQLAHARAQAAAAETALAAADEAAAAERRRTGSDGRRLPLGDFLWEQAQAEAAQRRRRLAADDAAAAQQAVQAQRDAYLQARQDADRLQRLRGRAETRWRAEQGRRQQVEADDLVAASDRRGNRGGLRT